MKDNTPKINVNAQVMTGGGFQKMQALKALGYDVDEHLNPEEFLMENDKARRELWEKYAEQMPAEALKVSMSPCAMCQKKVGKAPISTDGQLWCKREHIPLYLQERVKERSGDGLGIVAIGPDGKPHFENSLDNLRDAIMSPLTESISFPALPKEVMEHNCSKPNCSIKKIKELKELADQKFLEKLSSKKDDSNDPKNWN